MEEIGMESTMVEALKAGEKSLDIRLGTAKYLRIHDGNQVSIREDFWHEGKILESLHESAVAEVSDILYFESLDEALQAIDIQAAFPAAKSVDEARTTCLQFYSLEDIREYGIVVFTLSVINK